MVRKRNLVVIPQENFGMFIDANVENEFDLVTYSYNGFESIQDYTYPLERYLHIKLITEFWGESFFNLCLKLVKLDFDHVLFLNGDIKISVSTINKLFEVASKDELDFFQASLSHCSFYSHDFLLNNPFKKIEKVPFVEVMMPGLSKKVVAEIVNLNLYSISGWGMDFCLFPYIEKKIKAHGQYCIHECIATHTKPVESHNMKFSNGKSANEELEAFRTILYKELE